MIFKNIIPVFSSIIFSFQKIVTDLVNHVDSGDIKLFVQFPGNFEWKVLRVNMKEITRIRN